MASIDKPGLEPEKEAPPLETTAPDVEKAAPPPPPESKQPGDAPPPTDYFVVVDAVLRLFLFAAAVVAVVVMVTAKQTEVVGRVPFPPFNLLYRQAKFNHSPAFIYFVVALSIAGLYSIITAAVSFLAILKPGSSTKLWAHFIIFDVLLLGIVAAATGAAGGVAYIGLKGNSHVGWIKICNVYDKYCQYIGASIVLSLVASIVLVFLVILSAFSLSKKIPK